MDEPIVLGDFREFTELDDGPTILDALDRIEAVDRQAVIEYLTHGVALTAVPGSDSDVIDATVVALSSSILTDGEYIWRRDLAHYVSKYGVGLHEEFLERVRSGASPPEDLEAGRRSALSRWVAERLRDGRL